jgi:hypothetical protein
MFMGKIKRETIKFLLPVNYSTVISNNSSGRLVIPLYINPQDVTRADNKIIQESQTLGGFIIQYWGEKLTNFTVRGITGSGGIEAINILRSVYRNEQIQFKKILLERQRQLAEESGAILSDLASQASFSEGLVAAGDILFDGVVSEVIDSVSETIEFLKDPTAITTSDSSQVRTQTPTLASFAVSVDMCFQGEIHRGFFTDFSVTESAQEPGHFGYNFSFRALRSVGERNNFMPWHKSPTNESGQPVQSNSIYAPYGSSLSFPYTSPVNDSNILKTSTTIVEDQSGQKDPNQRSLSRFSDLSSKK